MQPPATDQTRGKIFHLGVVGGGSDVYPPSVQGTLTSTSTNASTNSIIVECLLDTGCLLANFVKADIARRLGTHTQSVDTKRLVTLADGSLTSSAGYVNCNVTLTHDETSMILKNVTLHILPGLAFDVILGFPSIRKYNLVTTFSYLFSESNNLQVHNCTRCRQCLPKVFQQERAPSNGETQLKVLLAVPCASALNLLREPCGGSHGGPVVEAQRSGRPGSHASVPQGLICDRKASDIVPVQLPWTAGTVEGVRRSGWPGGHASVPQKLICDRKASDIVPVHRPSLRRPCRVPQVRLSVGYM
jgi:hypothetical protein